MQLQKESGGLSGSCCYITTSSKLPTARLLEIQRSRLLLRTATLDDIHTISTPTIHILNQVLSVTLPSLLSTNRRKEVKLLVIDSLAELFHSPGKTGTETLIQRSRDLTESSILLHRLARQWGMAVLVLNEVVDVFDYGAPLDDYDQKTSMEYRRQSQWFGRAHSLPGQDTKEAALGLVWANQINSRIMLSRTGRRKYLDDDDAPSHKRHKNDEPQTEDAAASHGDSSATLIRRLTVIFSSVGRPRSMDYAITTSGVVGLGCELEGAEATFVAPPAAPPRESRALLAAPPNSQLAPLDLGVSEDVQNNLVEQEVDEWDAFSASDPIPAEVYQSIVMQDAEHDSSLPVLVPPTQFVESSQAEEIEIKLS